MFCMQPRPVLVAISHVPTSSGRMYDAAAVGAAAAAAGVPFLLDACQTAGQVPLDVQALQCDFLTGGMVGSTCWYAILTDP
jgi:selenocysteine lyase/cysteine desulfurase